MEPQYNEGPRDWQNLFALPRFCYVEVVFHIFYYWWGKKSHWLYWGHRHIEVHYIKTPPYKRASMCDQLLQMSTSHTHVCVSDHNHSWAWQFYSFPLFLQSSKVKRTPQDSINDHWPALTVTSCKGLTWHLVRSLYLLNELHHSNYTKNLHGQHGTTCIIITYLRNCSWWILSCKVDVSGPLLRKDFLWFDSR